MIIKEVLAPQTCTKRQQVSKAVPNNVDFTMTHFTWTEKIRTQVKEVAFKGRWVTDKRKQRKREWEWIQGLLRSVLLCWAGGPHKACPERFHSWKWTTDQPLGLLIFPFLKALCPAVTLLLIQYCVSAGRGERFFFRGHWNSWSHICTWLKH